MNKEELKAKLIANKVRKDAYSLEGGLPNEAYCLNFVEGFPKGYWEVYYSERGSKAGLKVFEDENEACTYFYDLIIKAVANR